MRKEILWAAAIGISFGLIIAFGAWRINSTFTPGVSQGISTPHPEPISEFKITLDKPGENDVLTQSSVTVSGITKSLTWITISGESGDYIIQSSENGTFEEDVDLIPGVNQIKLTAFDPSGNQSFEKVLVVYSSAFEPKIPSRLPASSSASDESSIRQKVQEKVEAALNKPKAFIGVVTDIADSTIQIKTAKGEIKQISVAKDNITVVKSGTVSKTVKLTDIAIGDFIVAMGYVNSNSVLSAQRILITAPVTEPKIEANFGEVSAYQKDLTVISKKESRQTTVTPDNKTAIFSYDSEKTSKIKAATIGKGDLVIYVTSTDSGIPSLRTIFIIQKSSPHNT